MNSVMNYNPGVGLQMTSSRQSIHERKSDTPSPQSYNVEFKLSDREKRQNKLISQRYDNFKKTRENDTKNPFHTMGRRGENNGDSYGLDMINMNVNEYVYTVRCELNPKN